MPNFALKIYPSGFLGAENVTHTKPIDLENIKKTLFSAMNIANPDGHTANLAVLQMYKKYIGNETAHKSFQFKEEVLKIALSAFGTDSVYVWVAAQKRSPYYGKWHSRWIDETLSFVLEGKNRDLSPPNWIGLLATPGCDGDKLPSPTVSKLLGGSNAELSIQTFILEWVRRPGGIDDLIQSLNILFGDRK